MGAGGGASSATEVRHLRESTLERVRLFVNHLGYGYTDLMRYWISLWRQFMTEEMGIRILGEDGNFIFPIIEKDDLNGEFDFVATVNPSFAGKNDLDKKQGMDLFQLLSPMEFVDQKKLTQKVLHSWNWALDSILKTEEPVQPEQMEGMPGQDGIQPGQEGLQGFQGKIPGAKGAIPDDVLQQALGMLGGEAPASQPSPFAEAGQPINVLNTQGQVPPTAKDISGKTSNLRGLNRGGKVNTNTGSNTNGDEMSRLLGSAQNLQVKK
jgi:hypothetical protein